MRAIPILMYHSVDASGSVVSIAAQTFREHLACIRDEGFTGISLYDAVTYYQTNSAWPEKSVVITFDDGYENVHRSALPALIKAGFTATVFLVSGHMGRKNDWAAPPERIGEKQILSWDQAEELANAGIEIGSHTHNHPDLRRCEPAEVARQIVASRKKIEDHLSVPVRSFAYPYGAISETAMRYAAREYAAACTTLLKQANGEPLHSLPRIDMYYISSIEKLRRLLKGELDTYLALRRLGRAAREALKPSFKAASHS